ncbi:alpha/beta fold hydrolase [Roseovarius spongiae]|uniref:Alpha/beta fold hydrolase n=1 Tax=Roseovarius spongiae TaxID=2320272 RepID=A0A3A8ASY1_9RHOB|nr:alpha/beta fold hydrolase [Roseovarius spongiae]RKF13579.1 alpha/beta fold hydrolase [Roseovarius spongiae]
MHVPPRGEEPTPPDTERDRLIEAIYRIALDPQSYDDFMDRWGGYVSRRLLSHKGAAPPPEPANAPELDPHFAIATQLLDQTMPPPVPPDAPGDGLDANSDSDNCAAPRFLIDSVGRIVWYNTASERLLGLRRGATLDDLPLEPGPLAALRRMAARMGASAEGRPPLALVMPLAQSGEVLHMQAGVIPDGAENEVIVVAPLAARWPAAMAALLRDDFGLTRSETEICEWIANGHSAAQIAGARDSALATVRTQIKRIMAKMRTTAQPELVRLLHLLMRLAETHRYADGIATAPETARRYLRVNGRAMPVNLHGPEDGAPVIFLHGMLDGTDITQEAHRLLDTLKLRLVCPVRPFFGAAEGDPGPPEGALARMASDIAQLMRQMGLGRAVLMGHMAGALYAFAAAAETPERFAGVVNVAGGVPILGPGQFASMAPRQRLVAYTARYSPAVLPFVLRAGVRQLRSGGERRFLLSLYQDAPADLPVALRPEVQAILRGGYRFSVAQGHRAFEIDSHHVVQDWTEIVERVALPVQLVHGTEDPVVSIASVRAFADGRANCELIEAPETGQLVFYKTPGLALRAARELLDGVE